MKLIISSACYFLLCSIVLAEQRWCKYSDAKGETVFEKICKIEALSQPNCRPDSLKSNYEVIFNSSSSAHIETACKSDGSQDFFVNEKRVYLGTVRVNGSEYYELIFPESDEKLLLSKTPIGKATETKNKLPPWWEGTPEASAVDGKCLFVKAGKYSVNDCRQSTVCSYFEEGGCTYTHYFNDGSTLVYTGAEESYRIEGGDFHFSLGEISSTLNRTCFPSGYIGERFCFHKNVQQNEKELHPPKTVWVANQGDEKYLLYGTDGVNYGSAITIEKQSDNQLLWRTEGYITCSNGAVICRVVLPVLNSEMNAEQETAAVLETISDEAGEFVEWVVFAALSQNLYYAGGVKVEPFKETGRIKNEPETAPNIFQRLDYAKARRVLIQSFECQDNCYLTVVDDDNVNSTYLCQVDLCSSWAESELSLANIIGRHADIFIASGEQVNSDGDVMGTMEAVHEILIQ